MTGHLLRPTRAARLSSLRARWRALLDLTEPVHPETLAAVRRRWSELPMTARTPAQTLGRIGVGCEGTHGVFPKCNLTCSPCYHSADANKVRTDGVHTLDQVRRQMALLRRDAVRAPTPSSSAARSRCCPPTTMRRRCWRCGRPVGSPCR